MTRKVQ